MNTMNTIIDSLNSIYLLAQALHRNQLTPQAGALWLCAVAQAGGGGGKQRYPLLFGVFGLGALGCLGFRVLGLQGFSVLG